MERRGALPGAPRLPSSLFLCVGVRACVRMCACVCEEMGRLACSPRPHAGGVVWCKNHPPRARARGRVGAGAPLPSPLSPAHHAPPPHARSGPRPTPNRERGPASAASPAMQRPRRRSCARRGERGRDNTHSHTPLYTQPQPPRPGLHALGGHGGHGRRLHGRRPPGAWRGGRGGGGAVAGGGAVEAAPVVAGRPGRVQAATDNRVRRRRRRRRWHAGRPGPPTP